MTFRCSLCGKVRVHQKPAFFADCLGVIQACTGCKTHAETFAIPATSRSEAFKIASERYCTPMHMRKVSPHVNNR